MNRILSDLLEAVDIIAKALQALHLSMRSSPDVRNAVLPFCNDFRTVQRQIKLVSNYKKLHDELQELEIHYYLLMKTVSEKRGFDEDAFVHIILNERDLRKHIRHSLAIAQYGPFGQNNLIGLTFLEAAQKELANITNLAGDVQNVGRFIEYLQRAVQTLSTPANRELHEAVRNMLKWTILEDALQKICASEAIRSHNEDLVHALGEGIDFISILSKGFVTLVDQHDDWQNFDNQLNLLRDTLGTPLVQDEVLRTAWIRSKKYGVGLYGESTERWAEKLKKLEPQIDAVLSDTAKDRMYTTNRQQLLTRLAELLDEQFGIEELRTLCYNLGVQYDDLSGEGESAKARELIAHLDRKNAIPGALEIMKQIHKDICWPNPEWIHDFRTYHSIIKAQFGRIDKNLLLLAEHLHGLSKGLKLLSREGE